MPEPRAARGSDAVPSDAVPSDTPSAINPIPTRAVVLGGTLWMLGSWIWLWLQSGFNGETCRAMGFAATVGLCGAWPALRLSQASPDTVAPGQPGGGLTGVTPGTWARGCREILTDWLGLTLLLQTVWWPLQTVADWPLHQTLWLSLTLAGTSLLIGLLIAWARGSRRGSARSGAMLACVGVVLLEPALMLASGRQMSMRISPLQSVWTLTRPGAQALGRVGGDPGAALALDAAAAARPTHLYAQAAHAEAVVQTLGVGLAAVTGWIVLGVLIAAGHRVETSLRAAAAR